MIQTPPWPSGLLVRLTQLRDFGLPYRDIAATLSREYNCVLTRNAISGLVHRMGLPPLPKQPHDRKKRIRKRNPRPRVQPPPVIVVAPPPPPPLPVGTYSIFDLKSSSCRYPTGEGPFLFCGETKADGRPYCKEHAKRCFHG